MSCRVLQLGGFEKRDNFKKKISSHPHTKQKKKSSSPHIIMAGYRFTAAMLKQADYRILGVNQVHCQGVNQ